MKTVSIIILNFNGSKDTLECLKSVEKLVINNYKLQVVVVDNGSTDGNIDAIRNFQFSIFNFQFIKNKENLGFSGGNNVGIRYARDKNADYILLLNNDTIIDKHIVSELLKVAESNEEIGIVAPKIYFAKGHEFHKNKYKENERGKVIWYAGGVIDWNNVIGVHKGVDEVDKGQHEKTEETNFASGCCMMVKKEVFQKVGFLEKKYFLYYEDSDFSERIKKAGFTIMYAPLAFLWHKNAGSTGGSGSKLQDYYITRNRMLFGMRYAPFRSKLALIKESIFLFMRGRVWQKRGILDFYLGKFGRGSYAIKS